MCVSVYSGKGRGFTADVWDVNNGEDVSVRGRLLQLRCAEELAAELSKVPCRTTPLWTIQLPIAPSNYCGAAVGRERSQAQAPKALLKQGTREHLVDALGPSAPTPAATRHTHAQSMPPLALPSLLRVLQLAQKCVGRIRLCCCHSLTLCLSSSMID